MRRIVAPELLAVRAPHGVADHELFAAVAVHVERVGVVPQVALPAPQQLQIVVEDPEGAVAVLDQDWPACRQVEEVDRIADLELVRPLLVVRGRLGHPGPLLHLAGPAVQHLDLEILHHDDFVLPVAVEVVDLERRVVREHVVIRVRTPDLPQHLAVERDRRQATDVVEGVPRSLADVLRDQHVDLAVAVQVAEAHVAARAVVR